MNKREKEASVLRVKNDLVGAQILLVCLYKGVNVESISVLRSRAREVGVGIKVVKNSLLKIALLGTEFESVNSFLKGQLLLVYSSGDMVEAVKLVSDFAKDDENFVVNVGGVSNGDVLDKSQIEFLSKLPSSDAVRVRFLNLLLSPSTKLVTLMSATHLKFIRLLKANMQSKN